MTHSLTFTVPGDPVTKGRPRTFRQNGRTYTNTPQRTKDYESKVALFALVARNQFRPGPWPMKARFYVAIDIHPATRRRADLDNLAKSALDGCIGHLFLDDAQVDDLRIRRCAVDKTNPRAVVTVTAMQPSTTPPQVGETCPTVDGGPRANGNGNPLTEGERSEECAE